MMGSPSAPTLGIEQRMDIVFGAAQSPVVTDGQPAEPLTLLERVEALERAFASVVLAAGNNAMRACGSDRHPATAIFGDTPNG